MQLVLEWIQASLGSARQAALVSALPAWVDRSTCKITEPPGSVRASFYCCCVKKVTSTVRVGVSLQESAAKLSDSVKAVHDACQPVNTDHGPGTTETLPATAADPSARAKQLEATISSQKRKVSWLERT